MRFYGNALLEYNNQGIRVLPDERAQGDNRSEVRMEVTDQKGVIYPVSYTMVKINNQWRMRNVIINGINLGKLFRDQFAEAMQRNAQDLDRVIDTWVDTVAKTRTTEEDV
jgi:phospholipid transport system substrate-binding protein